MSFKYLPGFSAFTLLTKSMAKAGIPEIETTSFPTDWRSVFETRSSQSEIQRSLCRGMYSHLNVLQVRVSINPETSQIGSPSEDIPIKGREPSKICRPLKRIFQLPVE